MRTKPLAIPFLLALATLTALTACSLTGRTTGTGEASGTPASAEEPSRVSIPSIGVDSALLRLGLNSDDTVQVPPPEKGMTAGWYTGGATPGTPGAAVIIGHNDTREGKAVFHDLGKVGKGAAVNVKRGDGEVLHFTVTGTEKVGKDAFPTRKVYGETSERALRLVTCAGELDADGHPVENLIVYATLKP
ncbi:peptidase C60 [Streptomyces albireticuli]|uniref:Peptidase C60 n=1 Tax=Streptomyces albireticuli TaxID=1940 RepID=A0A1Z2L7L5_9ACTN|nr:class F sortase [Streptomyces albireticuli]ARZ70273.1 peptidase C60 [Streptomyces albireticuli]